MTAAARAGAPAPASEAALAGRWAAGLAGPLRLEDGRVLRVVFPGVPGPGPGPDFRGAILDAGGDLLRGDVEIHLRASGWRVHGHEKDPAYAGVVLHAVAANDLTAPLTHHQSGRLIPVLVFPAQPPGFPPPFTPPCALACRSGYLPGAALDRLGLRRLRIKAARTAPAVAAFGPGQALYGLLLETFGGNANRDAFAALARAVPLAHLLEAVAGAQSRPLAFTVCLEGGAPEFGLIRAGLRPMASPARRLEAAGALLAKLWPEGAAPGFPLTLGVEATPRSLQVPGVGRALALECLVNAVLPVALASGSWPEAGCEALLVRLASPGTYGRLRRLEGWLAAGSSRPFTSAARLQGGLLLHADYCSRGMCGRCPVSPA